MEKEAAISIIKRMYKGNPTAEQLKALELAYAALSGDKPAMCKPEYLGENTAIGCRVGRCKCGNIVRSYHNFCNECGTKLEWGVEAGAKARCQMREEDRGKQKRNGG